MNLFLSRKEILIDDAGWGALILGVVIGALQLPNRKYMRRRIPTASFQSPNFENKRNDKITLRIPLDYRDTSKYIKLPAHLYNYQDLDSLLNLLKKLYNKK